MNARSEGSSAARIPPGPGPHPSRNIHDPRKDPSGQGHGHGDGWEEGYVVPEPRDRERRHSRERGRDDLVHAGERAGGGGGYGQGPQWQESGGGYEGGVRGGGGARVGVRGGGDGPREREKSDRDIRPSGASAGSGRVGGGPTAIIVKSVLPVKPEPPKRFVPYFVVYYSICNASSNRTLHFIL